MANYGICYMGSKNKIAQNIINLFPPKTNFYDLFAGGCSITHAALLSNKYKFINTNDINPGIINLFKGAIHGEYTTENRRAWVSKKDFFKYKDTDPYIFYLWSFGNMGKTYLYSEEIEPYKKALHYAIFENDFTDLKRFYPSCNFCFMADVKGINARRLALQQYFKATGAASGSPLESSADAASLLQSLTRLQSLERLESLERLNKLESLERLNKLESLERLNFTSRDFSEIEIKNDSVIYCDIPYLNTEGYNGQEFDFTRFYKWAAEQKEILFISSYELPADQFLTVAEIPHRCTLSQDKHESEVIERVFIPKHQAALYESLKPQPLLFEDFIY